MAKKIQVKSAPAKKPCDNCHFMGDASGLVDENTLCPKCAGTGLVK